MADRIPKAKGATEPSESDEAAYTNVESLVLAFEANDLPSHWEDMLSVEMAMKKYLYTHDIDHDWEWSTIKLRDSEADLKEKLQKFLPPVGKVDRENLFVIYYGGNACLKDDQGLVLRR